MFKRAFPILCIAAFLLPVQVGAQPATTPLSLDSLVNDWWCSSPGGTPTYANLQQTVDYLQRPAENQALPIAQALAGLPIDTFSVLYLHQFGAAGSLTSLIALGVQLQAQELGYSQSLAALSSGDTAGATSAYSQANSLALPTTISTNNPAYDQQLNARLSALPPSGTTPPTDPATVLATLQQVGEVLTLVDSQFGCGYAPIRPSLVMQVNKVAQFQIGDPNGSRYLPIVRAYPGYSDYALVGSNHDDRTARLVYLPTQQVTPLFSDTDFLNAVAFSGAPNPQLAAIAGGSGTVWVIRNMDEVVYGSDTSQWSQFAPRSKATRRQQSPHIEQWLGHTGAISALAFSPDGSLLASAAVDGTARLWDTATGQTRFILAHDGPLNEVAFSSDGTLVATGSTVNNAGILRVWEVSSGAMVAQLEAGTAVAGLGATPDGGFAYGTGSSVMLWHRDSDLRRVAGGGLLGFTPDHLRLLTIDFATLALTLWDYQTGTQVASYTQHTAPVSPHLVDFSADGQLVITGDVGDTLHWWLADTGVMVGQAIITTGLRTLDFTPRERSLLVGGWDGSLAVYAVGPALPDTGLPDGPTPNSTPDTPLPPTPCVVQALDGVNLRAGAGTEFARTDGLNTGEQATADGQVVGSDGLLWYRVESRGWVRSDVVFATGDCDTLPVIN